MTKKEGKKEREVGKIYGAEMIYINGATLNYGSKQGDKMVMGKARQGAVSALRDGHCGGGRSLNMGCHCIEMQNCVLRVGDMAGLIKICLRGQSLCGCTT